MKKLLIICLALSSAPLYAQSKEVEKPDPDSEPTEVSQELSSDELEKQAYRWRNQEDFKLELDNSLYLGKVELPNDRIKFFSQQSTDTKSMVGIKLFVKF